ncbi:hypothetical protein ACLMJK_000079 [Lecanora helva]
MSHIRTATLPATPTIRMKNTPVKVILSDEAPPLPVVNEPGCMVLTALSVVIDEATDVAVDPVVVVADIKVAVDVEVGEIFVVAVLLGEAGGMVGNSPDDSEVEGVVTDPNVIVVNGTIGSDPDDAGEAGVVSAEFDELDRVVIAAAETDDKKDAASDSAAEAAGGSAEPESVTVVI